MTVSCLFCRIARGELPATIVHASPAYVAFRDIDPQAPTHVLVIPRAHVPSIGEADAATLGGLLETAAAVARKLGLMERGFRTVINAGPDAGQTVSHVHAHVLGGRAMRWPPG